MKTFWQHDNGKVYAVRSDTFGQITGADGPFEVTQLQSLEDCDYGPAIVDWIKRAIAEHKLHRVNLS